MASGTNRHSALPQDTHDEAWGQRHRSGLDLRAMQRLTATLPSDCGYAECSKSPVGPRRMDANFAGSAENADHPDPRRSVQILY